MSAFEFVADAAVVNPNGIKMIFTSSVSTFFINGKPTFINGQRKLSNPPPSLIIFPVAPFNKIYLFSKDFYNIFYLFIC